MLLRTPSDHVDHLVLLRLVVVVGHRDEQVLVDDCLGIGGWDACAIDFLFELEEEFV